MTLNQSARLELTEVLRTVDGGEVMRLMLGSMLQALVDTEATALIGADPHERSAARTAQHQVGGRSLRRPLLDLRERLLPATQSVRHTPLAL